MRGASHRQRSDPVDDLRDGWDLHIEFGVQHPALYLLMYGNPDQPHQLSAEAETAVILRGLVEAVARAGRLHIDIETATAMIHSTGIGVVFSLIREHDKTGGRSDLSIRVREAILGGITAPPPSGDTESTAVLLDPAVHASALRAALSDVSPSTSAGEAHLLDELLARISAAH